MKYLQVATFALIIVLAISLEYTYTSLIGENQQLKQQLNQSNYELNGWKQEFATYYYDYAGSSAAYENISGVFMNIDLFSAPINPPVTADQAIELALQYGGWNLSSLQNASVDASFGITSFKPLQSYHLINESYGNISSYAPFQMDNITYRYVWAIQVSPTTYSVQFPYHYYLVDSRSGEVFPASGLEFSFSGVTSPFYSLSDEYIHWPYGSPLSIDYNWVINDSEILVQVRDIGTINVTIDSAYVDNVQVTVTPDNFTLSPEQVANYTVMSKGVGTTWGDSSIHELVLIASSTQTYIGTMVKK